jgi:acetylornithine/succinyldiaminopimelate/putrescine aminotransferase
MVGVELAVDGTPFVQKCMERGLLINCTHKNVLRLLPAMNIEQNIAQEGLGSLHDVLKEG